MSPARERLGFPRVDTKQHSLSLFLVWTSLAAWDGRLRLVTGIDKGHIQC